jgi:prepilin signal peptidase PulO-like enzyme (type II secretory pathway)
LGEHFLWKNPVAPDPQSEDDMDAPTRFLNGLIITAIGIEVVIGIFLPLIAPIESIPNAQFLLSLDASIVGAFVGGGVIYIMGLLGDYLFRKDSMGGGDIKLMALVGAFLGWGNALLAFFISPFFGACYGLVVKLRTKESAIAYGPFLVMGALIALFCGDQIILFLQGSYALH